MTTLNNNLTDPKALEVKSWLRDLKCRRALGEGADILPTLVDRKRQLMKTSIFKRRKRKYLGQLVGLEGVLTGSGALSLYTINGKPIFNRGGHDQDWLLTRDNFMRFCGMNDFKKVSVEHTVCMVDFHTGYYGGYDSYGHRNMDYFHTWFDIIGIDERPYSHDLDGIFVSDYMEVLDWKMRYLEKYSGVRGMDDEVKKHTNDLFEVMTKVMAFG